MVLLKIQTNLPRVIEYDQYEEEEVSTPFEVEDMCWKGYERVRGRVGTRAAVEEEKQEKYQPELNFSMN